MPKAAPKKEIVLPSTEVNYWLYYTAETIQDASRYWSTPRLVAFITSSYTLDVQVRVTYGKNEIGFKLTGECWGDEDTVVEVELDKRDLSDNQRLALLEAVKRHYGDAKEGSPRLAILKAFANALNLRRLL